MCLKVKTPLVNIIIGEGGSGGAVALASGDYVMMLEHSVYSVISPEGCASILWRNDKMAAEAAEHLGLTAQVLHKNNIINEIIKEPLGGAHRDHEQTIKNVKEALINAINFLSKISPKDRKIQKQNRYLNIGKEVA
jgi:acetyl-CoA carboxylase carboxyl transferase subunit alpha